jgi:hypothetical protein
MLLYEMLMIGIAVVLVMAAIDRLAARVMMGPEEMALLRLARAATAQRGLVASWPQQPSGSGRREPQQPSAASWPQQPSRSGKREPQQPSAASWCTGRTHSRHRSQRVSLR